VLPSFFLVATLGLLLVLWSMGLLWLRFRAWRGAEEQAEEQAEERAEALLRELLSEEEYRQLGQLGYLEVRSRAQPGRRYRIPRHWGLVQVLEDAAPITLLCVKSMEPVPTADGVLMHKLMIEGNEEDYLRIANRFQLTRYGYTALPPRGTNGGRS
jgi:hypothetical protein